MKIVLIDKDDSLRVDGIGMFTRRLREYLENHGHLVYIFKFSNSNKVARKTFHIPYFAIDPQTFFFVPKEDSLTIFKKYLKELQPDIVYTPIGFSPLDIFLPSVCHELGIAIAGVWHMDFSQSLSSYQILFKSLFLAYTPICKQFDLLHVFSEKLGNFYLDKGIDPGKILVLANGVRVDFYKKKNESRFAKENNLKTGILFLGRLNIQKDPEILIKSFLEIDPPHNTKLILVGNGELENELQEKYNDERLFFTGLIKDEKTKLDIMSGCEIFALPSRFEGVPLALLEAMACGMACVVSDAGSNEEVLAKAGIVMKQTQIKSQLPLVLKLLLEHKVLRKYLGRKARDRVSKNYAEEIIFKRLNAELEKTIAKQRQSGFKFDQIELNKRLFKKIEAILRKARDYITPY